MAWDKNLPSGGADIAQGDDAIRANNAAIETAVGAEHEFSTGGDNSGRHKFGSGDNATRNGITTWVDGSIWFNTQVRSGAICLQRWNGAAWVDLDLFQSSLPRVNEQSTYSVTQWGTWASVTPAAGTPDTLAIDLSASAYKRATIVGDTLISNPTNALSASSGCTCILQLTMSGAGHVITWGSNYRTPGGVTPAISSGNGDVTLVYIQSVYNGLYLVTTMPGLAAI